MMLTRLFQTTLDPLMMADWERVLNGPAATVSGRVYELYFPEEMHAADLRRFDLAAQIRLPDITQLPDSARLPWLQTLFETLHNGADLIGAAGQPTHP